MIFIVGVPRSGKSTLAKKLKLKYQNSNIISCDAIRNTLGAFNLGQGASCSGNDFLIKYTAKIAEWNEILTGQKSIVDAGSITIESVFAIAKPNDRIICLGFGGKANKEDIWQNIQKHQQEFDKTYGMDLDKAVHYWGDFGRRDQNNRYFCVDNELIYLDTADNQTAVLDYIINLLNGDFE